MVAIQSVSRKPLDLRVGVLMATYDRPDGSSSFRLDRALDSLLAQYFSEWKLFLVSDGYSDKGHLESIKNRFPQHMIEVLETGRIPESRAMTEEDLCNSGVVPYNLGLEHLVQEGFGFGCQLTDDDVWAPEHLKVLIETYLRFPRAAILYTQALYRNQPYPNVNVELGYCNHPPAITEQDHHKRMEQILTSMMFRVDVFRDRVRGRDTVEQGRVWPADMDLVDQALKVCSQENFPTVFIPQVTVYHEVETSDIMAGQDIWKG